MGIFSARAQRREATQQAAERDRRQLDRLRDQPAPYRVSDAQDKYVRDLAAGLQERFGAAISWEGGMMWADLCGDPDQMAARDAHAEPGPAAPQARQEAQHGGGIFHAGPGTVDVSGQVLGSGNVRGAEHSDGTPQPTARRDRERQGPGPNRANYGVINSGPGRVSADGAVMGQGVNVSHADREAGA